MATPEFTLSCGLPHLPALVEHARQETLRWHRRGIPLTRIAQGCGVHRNTLMHWLAHPTQAKVQTLLAVAAWLTEQGGLVP